MSELGPATMRVFSDTFSAFLGGVLMSLVLPLAWWRCGLAGIGLLLLVQACIPERCFR